MRKRKPTLTQVERMQLALRAIAVALKEPAGGEYMTARRLANRWGIYNDDLSGSRVLLRLAQEALRKPK